MIIAAYCVCSVLGTYLTVALVSINRRDENTYIFSTEDTDPEIIFEKTSIKE